MISIGEFLDRDTAFVVGAGNYSSANAGTAPPANPVYGLGDTTPALPTPGNRETLNALPTTPATAIVTPDTRRLVFAGVCLVVLVLAAYVVRKYL
jgi:hypothetical protein